MHLVILLHLLHQIARLIIPHTLPGRCSNAFEIVHTKLWPHEYGKREFIEPTTRFGALCTYSIGSTDLHILSFDDP